MGFFDSIGRGIKLIKLDGTAITEIVSDKSSFLAGWIIILIYGLLSALAISIKGSPFDSTKFIEYAIKGIVFGGLYILIIHGIAKLFGGQSKLKEYFSVQSHVFLFNWLIIFTAIQQPIIAAVVTLVVIIWGIVMSIVVVKSVHKLSTGKSIIVVLVPYIIWLLLIIIGGIAYFAVLDPSKFIRP